MNTRSPLCIEALCWLTATALSWVGCRGGSTSTRVPTTAQAPHLGIADAAWEYKTVEVEESSDAQMKETMQEFRREGWLLLWASKPLPQPDGTIHREYELKRPK